MSLIAYLRFFIVFCFLNLIFNTLSIAQVDNLSSNDNCPNIVDCLFMRNATKVQEFIDQGTININIQNLQGNTLLMWMVSYGYADMITLLLDAGADPNIADVDGATPLMAASKQGHLHIVRLFIERGLDVTIEDTNGNTASFHALSAIMRSNPYQDIDKIDRLLEIAFILRNKERGED